MLRYKAIDEDSFTHHHLAKLWTLNHLVSDGLIPPKFWYGIRMPEAI